MSGSRAALGEALRACLEGGITFAAFRAPGGAVRLLAQRSPDLLQVDARTLDGIGEAFVVAPFVSDNRSIGVLRPDVELEFGDDGPDAWDFDGFKGADSAPVEVPMHLSRGAHADAVESAIAAFGRGEIRKVVLSRTLSVGLDPALLPALFMRVLDEQPNAFVCMFQCPEHGLWMGASPERLLHAEGDEVAVDSIAGTLPSAEAPSEASAWGAKEREEQQLVTDGILGTFSRLGVDGTRTRGPEVFHAGRVAHLRSRITAPSAGLSLAELAFALHPSPAVCGTPTEAARAFILAYEPHDRGLYAGFWGPWRRAGRTELFVNIRTMRMIGREAVLYTGGGITAASDAGREWEETEQKALTWRGPIEALMGRVS